MGLDTPPNSWDRYMEISSKQPPRPTLVEALHHVQTKKAALDLGSGAMVDTAYLVEEGFERVVAVDKYNHEIAMGVDLPGVERVIIPFDEYEFPADTFDLINAQRSLPFNPPVSFNEVFSRLKASLKKDGIFVGQFFHCLPGHTGNENMTYHTLEEVGKLLEGMEVILLSEDSPQSGSTWSKIHVIARKA